MREQKLLSNKIKEVKKRLKELRATKTALDKKHDALVDKRKELWDSMTERYLKEIVPSEPEQFLDWLAGRSYFYIDAEKLPQTAGEVLRVIRVMNSLKEDDLEKSPSLRKVHKFLHKQAVRFITALLESDDEEGELLDLKRVAAYNDMNVTTFREHFKKDIKKYNKLNDLGAEIHKRITQVDDVIDRLESELIMLNAKLKKSLATLAKSKDGIVFLEDNDLSTIKEAASVLLPKAELKRTAFIKSDKPQAVLNKGFTEYYTANDQSVLTFAPLTRKPSSEPKEASSFISSEKCAQVMQETGGRGKLKIHATAILKHNNNPFVMFITNDKNTHAVAFNLSLFIKVLNVLLLPPTSLELKPTTLGFSVKHPLVKAITSGGLNSIKAYMKKLQDSDPDMYADLFKAVGLNPETDNVSLYARYVSKIMKSNASHLVRGKATMRVGVIAAFTIR